MRNLKLVGLLMLIIVATGYASHLGMTAELYRKSTFHPRFEKRFMFATDSIAIEKFDSSFSICENLCLKSPTEVVSDQFEIGIKILNVKRISVGRYSFVLELKKTTRHSSFVRDSDETKEIKIKIVPVGIERRNLYVKAGDVIQIPLTHDSRNLELVLRFDR